MTVSSSVAGHFPIGVTTCDARLAGQRAFTARLRSGVGGLLITVGTHVAGARPGPVELGRPST